MQSLSMGFVGILVFLVVFYIGDCKDACLGQQSWPWERIYKGVLRTYKYRKPRSAAFWGSECFGLQIKFYLITLPVSTIRSVICMLMPIKFQMASLA
ncbi:MAG: hypothetical protein ACOYN4_05280 [Bacteroidales bacterium]